MGITSTSDQMLRLLADVKDRSLREKRLLTPEELREMAIART
jgi:hypothetical protein